MIARQDVLTLEQFLRLPERQPALEYEDGRITPKVSPKTRHAVIQTFLAEVINVFARPRKVALAFTELRVNLGGKSWVPDISVFRWSRLPLTAEGTYDDDVFHAPDVAIEIASPGQSPKSMAGRCQRYLPHGTPVVLSIDPDSRTVKLYRRDALPRTVRDGEPIDLSDALPGFRLTPAELFASLTVR